MAQDVSSAADTLEERTQHTVLLKKPSIVHLYAEGGGVLGKMFPVFGNDWEQKTGIHFGLACPVKEAVSTGKPFITGISMPDPENPQRPLYWCSDIMKMYDEDCASMFAQKPRRLFNLLASNGLSLAKRIIDPSESRKDRAHIEKIKRYCDLLLEEVPADKKNFVLSIRDRATTIWLTSADTNAALKMSKRISEDTPRNIKKKIESYQATENAKQYITEIGFLLNRRSTAQKGWLRTVFTRAIVFSMDTVKSKLGPRENRFYSTDVKQTIFKMRMNDLKLDGLMGSIYTAAFSPRQMAIVPVFSRRHNLLDTDPNSPGVVSHPDMKVWDANMLTTANLLAYPPHVTEDGSLFVDKATIHTPALVISEIIREKPRDMGVVSLTFSTGHVATNELDDAQLYHYYAENGEVGNERFLEDSKAYTTTASQKLIANLIGEENVLYMSPRMTWKDIDEERDFPSTDILDARPENMAKIQRRAEKYLKDKEVRVNRIWQTLADNMYLLGQIDKPKFDEITARLGVKEALNAAAKDTPPALAQTEEPTISPIPGMTRPGSAPSTPQLA